MSTPSLPPLHEVHAHYAALARSAARPLDTEPCPPPRVDLAGGCGPMNAPIATVATAIAVDAAVLRISEDFRNPDSDSWETTLVEFLDDNRDDEESCSAARALAIDDEAVLGMGYLVRRIS